MKMKMLRRSGFKKKYSTLKRTAGFKQSPFYSLKRSSFKRFQPLTPKQQLDSIVSKCIRLGSADKQGMVQCVTCKQLYHWTIIQCGHFQKRANTSTRYEIKNLGPQCEDCNCFKDGENDLFAEFIDKHHGAGTADMLRKKAREIERYFPYNQEIKKWAEILKKLQESRNNQIEY